MRPEKKHDVENGLHKIRKIAHDYRRIKLQTNIFLRKEIGALMFLKENKQISQPAMHQATNLVP